jgi:acylphosphatase
MTTVYHARAIFKGHVQGVGFRYTTHRLARQLPSITGFVRNLPDGTVELLAEGTKDDLQSLLDSINGSMSDHIDSVDIAWRNGLRDSHVFTIQA